MLRRATAVLVTAAGLHGCTGNPTVPSAVRPVIVRDATALANLEAARALEGASGRGTMLVGVSGLADRRGHLVEGGAWYYTFRDPTDTPAAFHQWSISAAGETRYQHLGSCGFGETPLLISKGAWPDSDEVLQRVLLGGAARFMVERGEEARFGIMYHPTGVRVHLLMPSCYPAFVLLSPTGEITDANLQCMAPFVHPCVGPGVY